MAKAVEQEPTVQEKIYNLYVELVQAKKDKKDLVKAQSENIKRIEDEIKEILDGAEEEILEAQREAKVD